MNSPFIVPVVLFLSMGMVAAVFLVSVSPIGKAIAKRIQGKPSAAVDASESARLTAELEQLRLRLAELEERVDFSERLLAQARESSRTSREAERA